MREHDWEIYADSSGEPIKKDKVKNFNKRLKHIYSQNHIPAKDGNWRSSLQFFEDDFSTGTWYAECRFCGMKTKLINGRPLLWGERLDCDRMFAVYGIEKIMNS